MTIKCYSVPDTSWTESGITYNNAPGFNASNCTHSPSGDTPVAQQTVYFAPGAMALDLTNFVATHLNSVVTLQLISEDLTTQSTALASKEAASGGPALTISLQSGVQSVSIAGPVSGGNTAGGVVTLTQPARDGGVTVSLSSDTPSVATVPASVTVAAGATSASFDVTTSAAVMTTTTVTITASYNSTSANGSLSVLPHTTSTPTLTDITINPTSVAGGASVTGTLTLSANASGSPVNVLVSCSNSQAANAVVGSSAYTFPVLVSIPVNANSVPFTVTVQPSSGHETLWVLSSCYAIC